MTVIASVIGVGYAYSLWRQAERTAQVALESAETLKDEKKYQACMNQAGEVPQRSGFYTDAQHLLNQCQGLAQDQKRLAQAKVLVAKNNFKDGIAEASKIGSNSSLHQEAQGLVNQWSENLLKLAEAQYKRSSNSKDLESAIDITKAIPQTSSAAKKAKETTQQWQAEWNKNETYLQSAQIALEQRKWQEAIAKANVVKQETPYWQKKVKSIIETAQERIAAISRPSPPFPTSSQRSGSSSSSSRGSGGSSSESSYSGDQEKRPIPPKPIQQPSSQPVTRPTTPRSGPGGWGPGKTL